MGIFLVGVAILLRNFVTSSPMTCIMMTGVLIVLITFAW